MALTTVTVTWDENDIGQAPLGGNITFLLSEPVFDSADGIDVRPTPKTYFFASATGTGTSDPLVANDNASLQPTGSYYTVTVAITGQAPYVFATAISHANGASQTLSFLQANAAVPAAQFSAYLPLPSGTPVAGQVPAVITNGSTATVWTSAGGSGAVSSVFGRTGAVVATTGDYTATQVGADTSGAAAAAQAASLQKTSNLSDLASASTARTNLGLGSSAALPAIPWFTAKSGSYFQGQTSVTTATLSNTLLRVNAVPVVQQITIAQIGAELFTAGDANSIIRLAIYADDGTGYPGALVLDGGSISCGTGNAGTVATSGVAGVYMITLGSPPTLTPGLYWIGGAVQGVTVTQPVLRTATFGLQFTGGGMTLPAAGAISGGYSQSSVSGAMPSNFTSAASAGVVATFPRVICKIQ